MELVCEQCCKSFTANGSRGRTPRFCGARCRKRASRARQVLPASMTSMRRWVRADGKRPIRVDGSPASSTDPSTWASYSDVLRSTAGDGYGIMLGGGLGCYDIDHCLVDGVIEPWAREALDSIPESVVFTEVSKSGTGVHVFVRADESPGTRRGNVERYTRARFIRVTGNVYEFTEYNSCGG